MKVNEASFMKDDISSTPNFIYNESHGKGNKPLILGLAKSLQASEGLRIKLIMLEWEFRGFWSNLYPQQKANQIALATG